jgi:hypothetical protein
MHTIWPATLRLGFAMALAVAALLVSGDVGVLRAAETCIWGQPGYRDCVEALIARKRGQERARASDDAPSARFPTALPERRAPTLVPSASPSITAPSPPDLIAPPRSEREERQWQADLQRFRDRQRVHALRSRHDDLMQLEFERQRLDRDNPDTARYGVGQRQMDLNILRGQDPVRPLPRGGPPPIGAPLPGIGIGIGIGP